MFACDQFYGAGCGGECLSYEFVAGSGYGGRDEYVDTGLCVVAGAGGCVVSAVLAEHGLFAGRIYLAGGKLLAVAERVLERIGIRQHLHDWRHCGEFFGSGAGDGHNEGLTPRMSWKAGKDDGRNRSWVRCPGTVANERGRHACAIGRRPYRRSRVHLRNPPTLKAKNGRPRRGTTSRRRTRTGCCSQSDTGEGRSSTPTLCS